MAKFYRQMKRLTACEIKIVLNYLLFMSEDKTEYIASVIAFTNLLSYELKAFKRCLKALNPKTLNFILNALKFTKKTLQEVL